MEMKKEKLLAEPFHHGARKGGQQQKEEEELHMCDRE
jgi:hypothetical protein